MYVSASVILLYIAEYEQYQTALSQQIWRLTWRGCHG